jgi:hypothetical protein
LVSAGRKAQMQVRKHEELAAWRGRTTLGLSWDGAGRKAQMQVRKHEVLAAWR